MGRYTQARQRGHGLPLAVALPLMIIYNAEPGFVSWDDLDPEPDRALVEVADSPAGPWTVETNTPFVYLLYEVEQPGKYYRLTGTDAGLTPVTQPSEPLQIN